MSNQRFDSLTRRAFVQTSAALTAALAIPRGVYAFGSDTIRVGAIGCGGRGTGAIENCLDGSTGVELVAMGDLAPDRLQSAKERLTKRATEDKAFAAKFKVKDDACFSGFDAYQKVLAADVDLVILATPPGFRPLHLRAAVDAGKHIFSEKPVATDVAGVRHVLETYELARAKNLGIVTGTQRRHHSGYIETIKRIHDGEIGDVMGGEVYWNQGGLWHRGREANWTDMEWQLRNWLYFAWLSGDHIVEQHVHNLDVANWVMKAHPVRATGVGGRQQRTDPQWGHIYDHFAIDYEYPNGVHITSMSRQIRGTRGKVGEWFQGTKGRAQAHDQIIAGGKEFRWSKPEGWAPEMVQEHTDLVASIRAGQPLNELKQIAESTLTAIMGREAAYTGQEIVWDDLLKAQQDIAPAALAKIQYGPLEVPPVPVPGRTKVDRAFVQGW
ncbi:MAG TPA: Gfo/Idh/MocA family oxidoreductase [Longimicrobiales bacterium]|nr:Gfo/Idh/MocA family oxidoreductase [Longimicrobiales bacterium]